jgi:mannose-6-phosphate isomerase-like protein (cupin superfamily)
MNFLFGLPYHKGKIDSNSYNKKKIIEDINSNYERDPRRNKWSNDNFHHSNSDVDNPNFIDIDYTELIPLYEKEIYKFFSQYEKISVKNNLKLKIEIANYTASKNDQYMGEHAHIPSLFYGIHYLKFDSECHKATVHRNTNAFPRYTHHLYPDFYNALDGRCIENSWLYQSWEFDTQEDDFFIIPAIVEHSTKPSYSDKLRISVVMNIDLTN